MLRMMARLTKFEGLEINQREKWKFNRKSLENMEVKEKKIREILMKMQSVSSPWPRNICQREGHGELFWRDATLSD